MATLFQRGWDKAALFMPFVLITKEQKNDRKTKTTEHTKIERKV